MANHTFKAKHSLKNLGRRGLSLFMALVMLVSMIQISAFAAGKNSGIQIQKDATTDKTVYYEYDAATDSLVLKDDGTQTEAWVHNDGQTVSISKEISGTGTENVFDITLTVQTKQEINEMVLPVDASIVFVIDRSTSMNANGNSFADVSAELGTFIDSFATKYNADGKAVREVAVVSFCKDAKVELGWTNVAQNTTVFKNTLTSIGSKLDSGTSTEGGLALANALIPSSSTDNTFVILVTDGSPNSICYDHSSGTGNWWESSWNSLWNKEWETNGNWPLYRNDAAREYGQYYYSAATNPVTKGQDEYNPFIIAAERAKAMASTIKATTPLYTLGYGTSSMYIGDENGYYFQTTIGTNAWLERDIASSGCAYIANNSGALVDAFTDILNDIEEQLNAAEAWTVTDPMGDHIQFLSTAASSNVIAQLPAAENDDTLIWDLKNSEPVTSSSSGYTYQLTYTVQLDNLAAGKGYHPTNGKTTLLYRNVENGEYVPDASGSLDIPLNFKVPAVQGLYANLGFTKTDPTGKTLDGAKFQLYLDGSAYGSASTSTGGAVSLTNIHSANTYTLKEVEAPKGYTAAEDMPYTIEVAWGEIVSVTDAKGNEASFTLSATSASGEKSYTLNDSVVDYFDPAVTDKTVTKVWHVPAGTVLPKSITVILTGSDGQTYEKTMSGAGTTWTCTFESLPTIEADTGKEITYTVDELDIPGYTSTYNQSTLTITNSWNKSITVSKKWVDLEDSTHDAITVGLRTSSTADPTYTATLSESNGWSYTFENLPYSDSEGNAYTYTAVERGRDKAGNLTWVNDGQIILSGKTYDVEGNGYILTNTLAQETIAVAGDKTWKGPIPEGEVTITLESDISGQFNAVMVDGKPATATITKDNLSYSFQNLPRYAYEDGTVREIAYQVTDSVAGYTTEGGTANDNYDLTNTIEPGSREIEITKTWDDGKNADDTRVDVTLVLSGNGRTFEETFEVEEFRVEKETTRDVVTQVTDPETGEVTFETTTESVIVESWKNSLTKTVIVPKYDSNGNEIVYTLSEQGVTDGKLTGTDYVSQADNSTYTVTNTLDGGETSRTASKVWNVPANALIPASIDVTLYKNGEAAETVTLSAANGWTYTWTSLAVYEDGGKISYEIKETSPEGFAPSTSEDGLVTTFTNTIDDPKTLTVSGTKTWEDEGVTRPSGPITVYLQSDEAEDGKFVTVAQQEISTADGQTYAFENLPYYAYDKDSDGAVTVRFIDYKVTDLVDGYTAYPSTASSSAAVDGVVTCNLRNVFDQTYTYVEGTKTWVDGNSTARPAGITVGLFQNSTLIDTAYVTAEQGWAYSFGKSTDASGAVIGTLPEKSGVDTTYTYVIKELDASGNALEDGASTGDYTVSYSGNNITNTRKDINDTRTVSVTKFWRGPVSSASITVDVYADGGSTPVDTITLAASASTSWTGTSKTLPKYNADGSAIVYTIKETGESGGKITLDGLNYSVSYDQDAKTLTNTVEQKYTSISGRKTWDLGGNDIDLPGSLTIALYADNQQVATTVTSAAEDWSFTFGQTVNSDETITETLPVYDLSDQGDGHAIVYTVRELDAQGSAAASSVRFDGKEYTVTYDGTTITNTFVPETSDHYGYEVYTHYLTYNYNGTLKDEDVETAIDYTLSYQPTAFTVNPSDYDKNSFTYQPDMSTLYIGTEQQTEASYPAETETQITVDVPNKTYKVDLYYTKQEEKPATPPSGGTESRTVTVHYLEVGTERVLHTKYTTRQERYTDYDVTAQDAIAIEGYTYVETTGDPLSGTLNSNKVIYVWYTLDEIVDIPDDQPPIAPDPGTDAPVEDVPESDIPKADVPETGDKLNFWMATAAASALGLIVLTLTGKKRKDETA